MQYSSDKKQKNSSLYAIILICAVAIGLIAYLAAVKTSNEKNKNNKPKENEISSDTSSYNSLEEYNPEENQVVPDNQEKAEETAPTENPVADVPYEEKQGFVMPINGNIIKGYSDTSLQYDKTYGDLRIHKGIDISCEENAKVVSASSGVVTDISESANYGTIITIDHGNGLTVKYCGLGSTSVTKGEELGAGVLIGTQKNPNCECMDENHIHIECIKENENVSPIEAFGFN